MDFESALSAEVTAGEHWILRIAQRVDQHLVCQGKEARDLVLGCHLRVLRQMAQSHLPPLANQEVETSQGSESLNFVNVVLYMEVNETVAAYNWISHQTKWVNRTRSHIFEGIEASNQPQNTVTRISLKIFKI